MPTIAPLLFAALAVISVHASARDYNEENCFLGKKAQALTIYSELGSDAGIAVLKGQEADLAIEYRGKSEKNRRASRNNDDDTVDLALEVIADTKHATKPYIDGCYTGTHGSFRREVKVAVVSSKAESLTGFKLEKKLRLDCHWQKLERKPECSPEDEFKR